MHKIQRVIGTALALAAALCVQATAGDTSMALSGKVGTLGLGADLTLRVSDVVNLRGTGSYLDFSHSGDLSDVDYDIDMDYRIIGALLDIHPFKNNFRISGGVLHTDNKIALSGRPDESVTIGNHEYPPEAVGTLSGDVTFDDVSPYAGIGFGNAVAASSWSFVFDLGVVFQSYDVALSADGPVAQVPRFQQDLREEEQDIEDDLNAWKIYPVLSFGIGYRF